MALHKISISVDTTTKIVRPLISTPGWTKEVGPLYAAGQILELPEFTNDYKDSKGTDMIEFELTEKQRDAVKKALTWGFENGALPAGKHTNIALRAFGVVEDD